MHPSCIQLSPFLCLSCHPTIHFSSHMHAIQHHHRRGRFSMPSNPNNPQSSHLYPTTVCARILWRFSSQRTSNKTSLIMWISSQPNSNPSQHNKYLKDHIIKRHIHLPITSNKPKPNQHQWKKNCGREQAIRMFTFGKPSLPSRYPDPRRLLWILSKFETSKEVMHPKWWPLDKCSRWCR